MGWLNEQSVRLQFWEIRQSEPCGFKYWLRQTNDFKIITSGFLERRLQNQDRARTGWLSVRIIELSRISGSGADRLVSQLGSTIKYGMNALCHILVPILIQVGESVCSSEIQSRLAGEGGCGAADQILYTMAVHKLPSQGMTVVIILQKTLSISSNVTHKNRYL